MSWFKRKQLHEELPEKIVKRAKMIPANELMDWAETTIYTVQRDISAIRSRVGPEAAEVYYGEALQSTEALLAILREVDSRTGGTVLKKPETLPPAVFRGPRV